MRNIMYRDAIQEALDEEMARDKNVFMMGEDVGVQGGNFKVSVGLRDKYGDLEERKIHRFQRLVLLVLESEQQLQGYVLWLS